MQGEALFFEHVGCACVPGLAVQPIIDGTVLVGMPATRLFVIQLGRPLICSVGSVPSGMSTDARDSDVGWARPRLFLWMRGACPDACFSGSFEEQC